IDHRGGTTLLLRRPGVAHGGGRMGAEPEQRYRAVEDEGISETLSNMLARDVVGLAAVKLLYRVLECHEVRPGHRSVSLTDQPGQSRGHSAGAGRPPWAAYRSTSLWPLRRALPVQAG